MSSVLQTPEVSQLLGQNNVHRNLYPPQLIEAALRRGEAELGSRGSLVAETGKRTGRSPKDKFIVRDSITENKVDWGSVNLPISPDIFDALYERVHGIPGGQRAVCPGPLLRRRSASTGCPFNSSTSTRGTTSSCASFSSVRPPKN